MGFLFGSDSTVNTTTNDFTTNQDNRVAVTADGSSVSIDGSGNSVVYTSSDPKLATDVANAGAAALIAASGTIDHSADVVRDMSRDVAGIANTNAGTLAIFSNNVTKTNTDNLASVRYLADQVAASNRQFLDQVNSLASSNMTANASARDAALSFGRYSLDNTLNFGRDALTKSQNQSDTALSAIRQTSSTLLDFINQNIKPADQQAFQATIPWLVGGAVIIGVFAFARGAR